MTSLDIPNDIQFADIHMKTHLVILTLMIVSSTACMTLITYLSSRNITPSIDTIMCHLRLPPIYRSYISTLEALIRIVNYFFPT